jgi:hypothetical protein
VKLLDLPFELLGFGPIKHTWTPSEKKNIQDDLPAVILFSRIMTLQVTLAILP